MTKITYVHNNPSISVEVEVTSAEKKYTLDDNPFSIPNKRVASYAGSDGNTYLPLQLIDIPTSNLTLTATMKDAGYVSVGEGSAAVDISDTVMNIVETKGKNQPFSFVTLSVSKQLFNSLNITLVQKSTKFTLNIYGIVGTWVFEKSEDSNAMYNFTLVKPAYYLKKTTLLSLLNFTISNIGTSYVIRLTNLDMVFPLSDWSGDLASFDLTFDAFKSLKVYVKRNVYDVQGVTKTDYSLVKISECDPDNLFRFLAQYVAEYSSSNITVRPGYYYTSIGEALLVEDTYSMGELESLKTGTTTIDNTVPDLKKVSIRLDEYCWDILQSLANLSNREIIFDDKAYFIPFIASNQKVSIDWEPSTDTSFTHIIPLSIAENDDQGSQYLVSSQKVIAEAYETTVAISDTTSTYAGADIKYLAIDDTRVNSEDTDNTLRNRQAKVVALNALLKNYKPGDCVQYSVCETTEPTSTHIISSWDATIDPSWTDFCYRTYYPNSTYESHKTYYYKSNGKWLAADPNVPSRTQSYNIDACLHTLRDNHNNITITNCPVAQIVTEYPACITTYTWGNPMFMDEQTQLSNLTSVSQDTVLDNTSDTAISSGDATKLVVGNQYVHQLRDDRAGFSGLIMEKNVDNNVYRLVGYDKGSLQTQFNSEGKIVAGANLVTLSDRGISIGSGSNSSNNFPTFLSLGNESSIEITDGTVHPVISLSSSNSSFKNDVHFEKNISVKGDVSIGGYGSKLSTADVTVTVVRYDLDGNPVAEDSIVSPAVVTSPSSRVPIVGGTYNGNRFSQTLNQIGNVPAVSTSMGLNTSNITWESGNISKNDVWSTLVGASTSVRYFNYESAKDPTNFPNISLTNISLPLNNVLKTQPVIDNTGSTPSISSIPSSTVISLPLYWEDASDGELSEAVQVTIGYKQTSYTYAGTGEPTLIPLPGINYVSFTISLGPHSRGDETSGNTHFTYFDLVLPHSLTQSTNNVLVGKFVSSLESVQIDVKLPLTRRMGFGSMLVGTLQSASSGNMFVSTVGAWGSTPVLVREEQGSEVHYNVVPNQISPFINQAYLDMITNSPYNKLGWKRIIALPSSFNNLPSDIRNGDIILYYV